MFSVIRNFFFPEPTVEENMYKIVEGFGNKFFIINARTAVAAEGTGSYSRRRDAVRGAQRRGLVLA